MNNAWLFASTNTGKVKEINQLLSHTPYCIQALPKGTVQVEETGLTFIENAILKARHAATTTSKPCLADDSGLVVPSLDGEPGVFSARYAGEHSDFPAHINKLLSELDHRAPTQRKAYFICVLALVTHPKDPCPLIAQGVWWGRIHTQAQGATGFGYDPIFWVPEYQKTVAELSSDLKNTFSHRAIALKALLQQLS